MIAVQDDDDECGEVSTGFVLHKWNIVGYIALKEENIYK